MKISIMFLLVAYLAISFALSIALSKDSLGILANLTHLNPPTDLKIVDAQLGELIFSWNSNLSEVIKSHFRVKYVFEHKYFDTNDWNNEGRLSEPKHESNFELHRGVYVRIKNVLLHAKNKIIESNWTVMEIPSPGNPGTLASNFSCIVYNISLMNCTWLPGNKVPSGTQYKMYYRQNSITTECAHYFTELQGRQGCHVGENMINLKEEVLICVNGSNNSTSIRPYNTELNPQDFEMYNPPVNVEISPNLTVKWDKPPGYNINAGCFQYQVQLTELAENNIEVFHVTKDTKFVLVNINLSKRYSVKVRVKLMHCMETKYWSNWSNEVFVEPMEVPNGRIMMFVPLMIVVIVGLLLRIIFRRYKIIIFRPIPDPQKKFKELFEEYNGDFQKWLGYQIPISKHEDCYTVVIDESISSEA